MRRGVACLLLLVAATALGACGRRGAPVRSRPEPPPAAAPPVAVDPAAAAEPDSEEKEP